MDLTCIRTLACDLTDDEVNDYAREVADLCLQVSDLEAEKASHAKHIKGRIDGLSADISDLSRKVKRRKEDRDVDCVWVYDWTNNVKQLERTDTREIIETRPIEQWERQQKLPAENTPEEGAGDGEDEEPADDPEGEEP